MFVDSEASTRSRGRASRYPRGCWRSPISAIPPQTLWQKIPTHRKAEAGSGINWPREFIVFAIPGSCRLRGPRRRGSPRSGVRSGLSEAALHSSTPKLSHAYSSLGKDKKDGVGFYSGSKECRAGCGRLHQTPVASPFRCGRNGDSIAFTSAMLPALVATSRTTGCDASKLYLLWIDVPSKVTEHSA